MATLDDVKLALRLTVNDYDSELTALIGAAKQDLGIAGVEVPTTLDDIVERAVITYCKLHFQGLEAGDFAQLKASYDEQKAQLVTATGYTDWLVTE